MTLQYSSRSGINVICWIWFQYDLSASQFSPDGRVFQIDYAGKAIEQSGTVIALRGKNGVVLAVEKIVRSPLYEEDAGARIYSIDKHIGIVSDAFKWLASAFYIFIVILIAN